MKQLYSMFKERHSNKYSTRRVIALILMLFYIGITICTLVLGIKDELIIALITLPSFVGSLFIVILLTKEQNHRVDNRGLMKDEV